jgi:BRCT domain type II-containing protein
MASTQLGFSADVTDSHRQEVQGMLQQWINEHGSQEVPAHLANLAARARVDIPISPTPLRRDKQDKGNPSTPTAHEGAKDGILTGLRFVLTGVWPFQGSGHGLTLGKEWVKQRIEKFGGIVTMSISRLTDALVVGDCPGKKKILEAHKRAM